MCKVAITDSFICISSSLIENCGIWKKKITERATHVSPPLIITAYRKMSNSWWIVLFEAPVLSFQRNNLSKTRGMPQARTEGKLESALCSCYRYSELFCQNPSGRSDSRHLVLSVPHPTLVTVYFFGRFASLNCMEIAFLFDCSHSNMSWFEMSGDFQHNSDKNNPVIVAL